MKILKSGEWMIIYKQNQCVTLEIYTSKLREDESLDFIIFVKICDFELFTYSRSQILLLAFSTHCCYEIKHFMS